MAEEELTAGRGRRARPAPEDTEPAWTALAVALIERELVVDREGRAGAPADAAVEGAEREFASVLAGDGPLAAIAACAELSGTAVRVLAVCAAVELDRRLQRLVAAVLHNPQAVRADVDLLTRTLGPDALAELADDSSLLRAALVEVEPGAPLGSAMVGIPRRVLWALLGDLSLDPDLPRGARPVFAPDPAAVGAADLVLVHGADRVRRVQAAVLAAWGLGFVVTPPPADEAGWRALVRQATVAGLGVVVELDAPLDAAGKRWIERADHLAWALCSGHPLPLETLPERPFVELAAAEPAARDDEWAAVFPDVALPARRPSAEQLRQAARVAGAAADPPAAIRRVASGTLLAHAQRIVPRVGWDELILPAAQEQRLHDLVDRYRQRGTVHDDWGLPLFPSPGVVVLFSGPSGTGKTTAAEVIARELGVDMFRVDLSALVSKYIGETEKNLEQIFSAAHAGDYLLLFDEADSLFGARSKVSDARDRYANMEVSYLLQRLETYDGFVVLTSNFQGNIDPAFLRRIHVTVHFPVPDAQDRERIWDRCLAKAPRDALELDFVAEKFELSGGSIRNAALTAAFLAAGRSTGIGMRHILQAVGQEMTKLGQRPRGEQFGRWAAELDTERD